MQVVASGFVSPPRAGAGTVLWIEDSCGSRLGEGTPISRHIQVGSCAKVHSQKVSIRTCVHVVSVLGGDLNCLLGDCALGLCSLVFFSEISLAQQKILSSLPCEPTGRTDQGTSHAIREDHNFPHVLCRCCKRNFIPSAFSCFFHQDLTLGHAKPMSNNCQIHTRERSRQKIKKLFVKTDEQVDCNKIATANCFILFCKSRHHNSVACRKPLFK